MNKNLNGFNLKWFFILCLIMAINSLQAQFCLDLITKPNPDSPEEVLVEIVAENFVNIASLQFDLAFDPLVYEYIEKTADNISNSNQKNTSLNPNGLQGILFYGWFSETGLGVNYASSEPFLQFKFKQLSAQESTIDFFIERIPIEVISCVEKDCETFTNIFTCNSKINLTPVLNGQTLLDLNNNCEINEIEITNNSTLNWQQWRVTASQQGNSKVSFLDESGNYQLNLFAGENLIELYPPIPLYRFCRTNITVNSNEIDNNFELKQIIQLTENCPYLSIEINAAPTSPCDSNSVGFTYRNLGPNMANDVILEVQIDERIDVENINLPATDLGNNKFQIALGDLPIDANGQVSFITEIPCDLPFNGTLCHWAKLKARNPCQIQEHLNDTTCQLVINPQDPVSLVVDPVGFGKNHYIKVTDVLQYVVFFDDFGNDMTFIDTLSPFLDTTTFKIVATRPNFNHTIENGVLRFYTARTKTSTSIPDVGFIVFEIKPQTYLLPESQIFNSITLWEEDKVVVKSRVLFHTIQPLPIDELTPIETPDLIKEQLKVYPNPTSNVVFFELKTIKKANYSLNIFSPIGRLLSTQIFDSDILPFYTNDLPVGSYFYQLLDGHQIVERGFFVRLK